MASVRIEDEAFSDVRYLILAAKAGLADADHARGKMALLWRQCTMASTYVLDEAVVLAVLGPNGVTALVASRLGEETPDGIRIKGTEGRIEWLARLRENGAKGGRKRADADKQQASGSAPGSASGSLEETKSQATPNPLSLALAPSPQKKKAEPPIPPSRGARVRGRKSGEPTDLELEAATRTLAQITRRTGVQYQGAAPHVRLIVGRLREGLSETDLRSVIAYCWAKSGLGWSEKLDGNGLPMSRHLVPETLFGPQKVHKYLAPAQHWFRTEVVPTLTDEERSALELEHAPQRSPPPAPRDAATSAFIANVLPMRRVP